MPGVDILMDYVIRYGFQVLGAAIVFAAGMLVARWVGRLTQQWLNRQDMEPPVRMLLVKAVQIVILLFTAMAALGQLGSRLRRCSPGSAWPDSASGWRCKAS